MSHHYAWMSQGLLLGALGCFLWGMVSVLFSPYHLASIPLIIGYVGGQNHLGHCIPVVVAGSSTAMVKRLLANSTWKQGRRFFRRIAGMLIK